MFCTSLPWRGKYSCVATGTEMKTGFKTHFRSTDHGHHVVILKTWNCCFKFYTDQPVSGKSCSTLNVLYRFYDIFSYHFSSRLRYWCNVWSQVSVEEVWVPDTADRAGGDRAVIWPRLKKNTSGFRWLVQVSSQTAQSSEGKYHLDRILGHLSRHFKRVLMGSRNLIQIKGTHVKNNYR